VTVSLPALLLAAAIGAALGVLYFEGLWLTTSRLGSARLPGLLLVASFLVRAAVLSAGLVLVMTGGLGRLLAALVGLVVARTVIVHRHRWVAAAAADAGER
jgi:F1F0 ATPase subunit 2